MWFLSKSWIGFYDGNDGGEFLSVRGKEESGETYVSDL
jgi:hypothetical protein